MHNIDSINSAVNFGLDIWDVSIIKNETGVPEQLQISAVASNPSFFQPLKLESIRGTVYLNGQETNYLRGLKWFSKSLQPQSQDEISWSYEISSQDLEFLEDAETNGIWNWYFFLSVKLKDSYLESSQLDKSQPFGGVNYITK